MLGERRVESKSFGWTARQVTALGMGTYYDFPWIIKSRAGVVGGGEAKVTALRAGLVGGIRLIDTAEIYNSEPLVARAIDGFPREDLFIATKVTFLHLRHDAFWCLQCIQVVRSALDRYRRGMLKCCLPRMTLSYMKG